QCDEQNILMLKPCTESQNQFWTSKSTDGGASWLPISSFSANTFAIVRSTDPQTPSIVYAGTDSGVLKSTDGGSTWNATDSPQSSPTDTTPPDTSITSAIDGNGAALKDQATTPSTSLTLTFTGTADRGVARFECRLDGAPDFSPCTSPQTYTGLATR